MSFYSELDNLSLSELIDRFHAPSPEGDEYAYTTYSEVALLIRQQGEAGVEFLWKEAKQADTTRLRAILLALTQPPLEELAIRGWLLSFLQDKRPLIVAEAIDSLGRQEPVLPFDPSTGSGHRKLRNRLPKGEAETVDQVLPLLKHGSPYVRGSVLRFMSEFYPDRALPLLIEGLKDPHFIVRENAADELGELEAVEALPHLMTLLEDPHPHVREAAETAIDMLDSLMEEQMADTVSPQVSPSRKVRTSLDSGKPASRQDMQVSIPVSKEAIHFLLEAIDYYLNDQDRVRQSYALSEGGLAKSDLPNGRYYLEAIKSNLKAVDTTFLSKQ